MVSAENRDRPGVHHRGPDQPSHGSPRMRSGQRSGLGDAGHPGWRVGGERAPAGPAPGCRASKSRADRIGHRRRQQRISGSIRQSIFCGRDFGRNHEKHGITKDSQKIGQARAGSPSCFSWDFVFFAVKDSVRRVRPSFAVEVSAVRGAGARQLLASPVVGSVVAGSGRGGVRPARRRDGLRRPPTCPLQTAEASGDPRGDAERDGRARRPDRQTTGARTRRARRGAGRRSP